MSQTSEFPIDLEKVSSLARELADLDMVQEAAHLFETALRLDPHNRGFQLGLAKIRNRLKHEAGTKEKDARAAAGEKLRRDAIDSCHFFGLAALYRDRKKKQHATECVEIALKQSPVHPYAYLLQGRIFFEEKRYDEAQRALRTARRYNPFDREAAELLGRVEREREQHSDALKATIDAFLLLPEEGHRDGKTLKERIKELKKILGFEGSQIVELFHERQEKLQTDFDRLELKRERYLQEKSNPPNADDDEEGRLALAMELRRFDIWKRLNDSQVFQVARVAYRETHPAGSKLFSQGDKTYDLYLVEAGEVIIRRPTHYGNFELARLGPGSLMGEVSYLSRFERSADGTAAGEVRLVRIDANGLDNLVEEQPALGVRMFMSFWQGLALKVRASNEQLRTFFGTEGNTEQLQKLRRASAGDEVHGASREALQLLEEKGLSGSELQTLADFSNVRRYPGGTFLFHEGDPGGEMYVVLEGKVMISKFIPGGGEEALAILERGDFFGEMSLIDNAPRSADAKAFQGSATVVAFDQQTLREVEIADPQASVDFIRLLCQLLCQRLREVDEKITSWRIMSGQRPNEEGDHVSFEFPAAFAEEVQG